MIGTLAARERLAESLVPVAAELAATVDDSGVVSYRCRSTVAGTTESGPDQRGERWRPGPDPLTSTQAKEGLMAIIVPPSTDTCTAPTQKALRVPYVATAVPCRHRGPAYTCTRPEGHSGRHSFVWRHLDGTVRGVWSQ